MSKKNIFSRLIDKGTEILENKESEKTKEKILNSERKRKTYPSKKFHGRDRNSKKFHSLKSRSNRRKVS